MDRYGRKIGLALGSGGAKGAAHIGAIRAFEEEGISFDAVAGTSIGSVVGALYAKSLCSDDMLALTDEWHFTEIQSLFSLAFGGGLTVSVVPKIGLPVFSATCAVRFILSLKHSVQRFPPSGSLLKPEQTLK